MMKWILSTISMVCLSAIVFVGSAPSAMAMPVMSLLPQQLATVYVGNLSDEVTEDMLTEVFSEYGTVLNVTMPTDRETGRLRGFGFVEMSSEAEEDNAIEELDGVEWMGRDIRVNKAKPRERRPRSRSRF